MRVIDHSSVIASLENALVPSPKLIDGRTEKDRLSFLSDFAALINFFDHNNKINGNWSPFLLKDPVFLLAGISRTKFKKYHTLYLSTCNKLEQTLAANDEVSDIPNSFNQLFSQLTRVFIRIERWTYYMQLGLENYQLKKYVLNQVRETYSQYFWAILSLRDYLSTTDILGDIAPTKYDLTNSFTDLIWTENKGKNPYWEVLNIGIPGQDTTDSDFEQKIESAIKSESSNEAILYLAGIIFKSLKVAGDELFAFFNTIVQHSNAEYEKVKLLKSKYPDTTLIRAFVELLKIQQEQLNGISQKHLEFYYKDILLQTELPAVADSVFISAVLAKTNAVFDLPAGTLFSAGVDAQKNPVLFASVEDVSLNPAGIAGAYTLSQWPDNNNVIPLNFQTIPSPGILQTDANGNNLKWETFGGSLTTQPSTLGFAFASPMLLLREGTREILVTLNFSSPIDLHMLAGASYSLSTAKAWLNVPFAILPVDNPSATSSVIIQFNLDSTEPAIEAFTVNPDGLNALWPMLKIQFNTFLNLVQPPVINSLSIEVNVSGVKTFQLYNDNGLLSTKTPFQLFGPIPDVNTNFIIGNNEIFSKPLNLLMIELDWDNLPSDFSVYYQAYNTYINSPSFIWSSPAGPGSSSAVANSTSTVSTSGTTSVSGGAKDVTSATGSLTTEKKSTNLFSRFGKAVKTFFRKIGGMFKSESTEKTTKTVASTGTVKQGPNTPAPSLSTLITFSNSCFTVNFFLLQNQSWNSFNMNQATQLTTSSATGNSGTVTTQTSPSSQLLFTTNIDTGNLIDSSLFGYFASQTPVDTNIDPTIQNETLTYTSSSSSGFMKMTLNGPSYGFGASIYPGVVSYTSLQNALTISSTTTTPVSTGGSTTKPTSTTLLPNPNLPFAPKVSGLTADYSAVQTYDFSNTPGTYPLQCFYYTPFANYTSYDNTTSASVKATVYNSMCGPSTALTNSILMFPSFPFNGALFIELTNLIPSNTLSLFFELARNYAGTSSTQSLSYYYLNNTGWTSLPLLEDGTNNLSCSGIIEFDIPYDIVNQSVIMPGTNNWIAITETGNPSSFAQTVLLTTNGVELQRSGNSYLTDTTVPQIAANVISKPQTAIPQIASLAQPFSSFGGKAAENQTLMNRRVSNRLKTKNRAVTKGDFFRLIRQEFNDIYYSKAIYNSDTNVVNVYVVQKYNNAANANAFNPMVSECEEKKIQDYLENRASLFSSISVSNFIFQYVTVSANIALQPGYAWQGVQSNIIQSLNIYLSPWITSSDQQIIIDKGISLPKVAEFISGIAGVQSVSGVSLSTYTVTDQTQQPVVNPPGQDTIFPVAGGLFVSSMNHNIQPIT
ncbi:MAG TPA: baseplate J/gp47 family protein [Bacteroidia bacterium]|nr:baseplate J/gp47 family protein [Bacteroidia bacterium]